MLLGGPDPPPGGGECSWGVQTHPCMHNGVFTPMHAWIRCEFVGTAAVFQTVQFFGPYASFGLWDCIQNGAAVKLRTTIGITHIGLNRNYQTAIELYCRLSDYRTMALNIP